jgi:hypothetical protein
MKRDKQRPVAVEDLLRLKRAERPADGFWVEFDRQLRAKQLAALVEKRSWWRTLSLSGFVAGFRRYQLLLGATAVLAISVASYRSMTPTGAIRIEASASEATAQLPVAPREHAASRTDREAAEAVVSVSIRASSDPVALTPQVEAEVVASSPDFSGFSSLPPIFGTAPEDAANASSAMLSQSGESYWSAGAGGEPVLSRSLLAASTRFEARAFPARPAIEPLKQITPPSERRGARILTAMVSMASVENAMRTTERAANRLSEEQLYEQIRRVGAFGAGVNVKF